MRKCVSCGGAARTGRKLCRPCARAGREAEAERLNGLPPDWTHLSYREKCAFILKQHLDGLVSPKPVEVSEPEEQPAMDKPKRKKKRRKPFVKRGDGWVYRPQKPDKPKPVKDYAAYLQSEHWKLTRRRKMRSTGWRCEKCPAKVQQVHHKHYRTLWYEQDQDLVSVCLKCHEHYHAHDITAKQHLQAIQSEYRG